ncbi:hypothetical protein [Roseicella aquatilis]|uniref:SDR family oxidoreductase n=1 Tax=Roseicella aquatilis TaxID=2527868 RepID=A0A4R4DW18_9PROT|nr:hypothetical protein [Roseicella aquatilis]TCZ64858.1 hypothetical protein EXY23_05645 [Roseicella aquatilis]
MDSLHAPPDAPVENRTFGGIAVGDSPGILGEDVGAMAAFPASDAARHVTGTVLPADGGQRLPA